MVKPLRRDLQGRIAYWLYWHGFPRVGNWLFIRSRTWREYVEAQYPIDYDEPRMDSGTGEKR